MLSEQENFAFLLCGNLERI